jgi:hypothetical protein
MLVTLLQSLEEQKSGKTAYVSGMWPQRERKPIPPKSRTRQIATANFSAFHSSKMSEMTTTYIWEAYSITHHHYRRTKKKKKFCPLSFPVPSESISLTEL